MVDVPRCGAGSLRLSALSPAAWARRDQRLGVARDCYFRAGPAGVSPIRLPKNGWGVRALQHIVEYRIDWSDIKQFVRFTRLASTSFPVIHRAQNRGATAEQDSIEVGDAALLLSASVKEVVQQPRQRSSNGGAGSRQRNGGPLLALQSNFVSRSIRLVPRRHISGMVFGRVLAHAHKAVTGAGVDHRIVLLAQFLPWLLCVPGTVEEMRASLPA